VDFEEEEAAVEVEVLEEAAEVDLVEVIESKGKIIIYI
jgi:hypothetical protein